MSADVLSVVTGFLEGFLSSSVFILVVMIGFCVLIGVAKLKKTAGDVPVIKSLDERIDGRSVEYLKPTAPRGPADQLRAPELLESRT